MESFRTYCFRMFYGKWTLSSKSAYFLHKKYVKSKPKITKKRTMNKTMNDYMKAKEKARKAGKKSFTYKGKTYTAKKTKTGMMVYKRKK